MCVGVYVCMCVSVTLHIILICDFDLVRVNFGCEMRWHTYVLYIARSHAHLVSRPLIPSLVLRSFPLCYQAK